MNWTDEICSFEMLSIGIQINFTFIKQWIIVEIRKETTNIHEHTKLVIMPILCIYENLD